MNLVFLKDSLPKRDLCVAETSAASARAEARGEQDERAARGELGEDEEKQVDEGQAHARALFAGAPWPAASSSAMLLVRTWM